jgi:hypothetical protein
MKRGIAISLYDKFEELSILHDILKYNFQKKYYLYVCSNHSNAESEIQQRGLKFDGFVQGEDITFSSDLPKVKKRLSLVCRSTDTVKRSCSLAIESGCDYVMHIHCDAWPLSEEKLDDHFKLIENNNNLDIAVRGLGWSYTGRDRPLGGIDDHFFVFNVKSILSRNIFDFDVLQMFPHILSIHGILAAQIITKLGINRCLYYDDFRESKIWDGEKKVLPYLPVKPASYDEAREFLHVHRESFPSNYGEMLQVYYLMKTNMQYGPNIKLFYEKIPYDPKLPKLLTKRLFRAQSQLKVYGYNYQTYAQEIKQLEALAKEITIARIIKNYLGKVIHLLKKLIGIGIQKDMLWPTTLEDYYANIINKEHYSERNEFWY